MDHLKTRPQRSVWTTYRSALALTMAIIVACASASWVLGALAPGQAQAADTKTISDVYGVTRSELVTWLESHEDDDYYLKTPYKPYDWRSPNGNINNYGVNSDGVSAGMNCTGFVWHALCFAHGEKDDIRDKLPALTGWAEAINTYSLENYTYATKEDMLSSKKLEKGDVIWMWDGGDSTKISNFHHVAIFWGDESDEDLMWHSSGDANNGWSGINEIGKIHGKASSVSYQVIKLGGKLYGGIQLEKKSADESVTDDNDNYSLKGAVYGIYETKADAKTHAEKKAIKTYSTNSKGKFKSEREFEEGTYYVAEITAPKGYALDENTYEVAVTAGKTVKVNGSAVKDAPLLGGFKLVKRSANSPITDGNGCYSLKGAVYGIFKSQADAETHDAGKAEKTYETGDDGTFQSAKEWAAGTYYVAETGAPTGYTLNAAVYKTTVKPDEIATVNGSEGFTADVPKSNPVTLWAAKQDAETADKAAQGSATLEGTLFEIAYYDGYYELGTLPASPKRTWVVKTGADGKAHVRDDLKVSGDDFYRTLDGRITLPLGTVTVREKEPPRGYLLGDGQNEAGGKRLIQIRANDAGEELGVYTAPDFSDFVKRGGVMIGKVDRQNGQYLPQGAATLAGATFQIVTDNDQQVMVEGTRYVKGNVVKTIETVETADGRFVAQTSDDLLPVGTYTLTEVGTSEGYLLDEASRNWSKTFEISEHKQVVDLTDPPSCVSNQVIRGDFGFSKVDGQTDARLGKIPFMVTSQTTGERHVIMTDENGMVSTATSWNAHSKEANANDEAVSESSDAEGGFSVDEEKLDPGTGVWFHGRTDAPVDVNDDLGALPYDTYTVSELRVANNAGYELAVFTVRISRHARELDLGTVDDNPGPLIGTSLSDGNDVKLAPSGSAVTLVDTVHYTNLDMRETYQLSGQLHLVGGDGSDGGVVSTGTTSFTPQGADGSVDVTFSLDTGSLAGMRLVAFEQLSTSKGDVVAVHEDLADEGQTVRVPSIGTTLVDAVDGDHGATADEVITLVDVVAYQGLTPGTTYIMSGELHVRGDDGSDGGIAVDEQGRQITARQSFTPNASEGEAEVVFSFSAPSLAGKTVVAFEELTRKDLAYAAHADISDEGQTVRFTPSQAMEGQPEQEDTPTPTPASVTPKAEKPVIEVPTEKPGKAVLPRTGDEMDPVPFVISAAAALGLAVAALCIRSMQRNREIAINRGPRRR